MSEKVNLNFNLDIDVKDKFNEVRKKLGMSSTTAFNILIRKMIRENRLPFDVSSSIQTNSRIVVFNKESKED